MSVAMSRRTCVVIFSYCTRNAVLDDTPSCFSGRVPKFSLGAMDLQVGRGKQINQKSGRWDAPGELLIVGEVKTDKMTEEHLARTYCDVGCKSCKYVVTSLDDKGKPKDKELVGDRHKHNSLVRQLYNYMVSNGLFYGMFSSHTYTAGFVRDCKGNPRHHTEFGVRLDCALFGAPIHRAVLHARPHQGGAEQSQQEAGQCLGAVFG